MPAISMFYGIIIRTMSGIACRTYMRNTKDRMHPFRFLTERC